MAFGTDIPSMAWIRTWIGVLLDLDLKEVDLDARRIKIWRQSKSMNEAHA